MAVRRAGLGEAGEAAALLHRFNTEYDEPTPGPDKLAKRLRQLLEEDATVVLLADSPAAGVAVLRFRPSIWTEGLEAYLAELYVVPERRREGLGRALMETALDIARGQGADYIELGTEEDDTAARALYESLGFSNRGGKPDGPVSYFYELEL